jgi:hypothetical protein
MHFYSPRTPQAAQKMPDLIAKNRSQSDSGGYTHLKLSPRRIALHCSAPGKLEKELENPEMMSMMAPGAFM